ncbi:MAG: uncharacterized protein QOD55_644 [Solirubrobacteraceae bacterium]|jgi:uncharacterized protein YcgI (DUF1989 family)|nr:uncharacterized protein [Solirubrobacteraceae bacterium]MEA2288647.1 uncharacterized protein [Solirubrobacteraceae bacterium]
MSVSPGLIEIAPKSAHALLLRSGQLLRVVDLEGAQVADLVAFNAADASEQFSQNFTRMNNDKVGVAVGDHLYSNLNTPMLRVEHDTVGVHDMLFAPCNAFFYERHFGIVGKTGCREHLTSALAEFGIGRDRVTDPFNVFMNTTVDASGGMVILQAPSAAGDHIDLRAEMDLIVAVSACAADVTDCNGGRCTGIGLVVEG